MNSGPIGHSPLGGSAAYRFLACHWSAGLSYGLTEDESEYAAEGTAAHWLAEQALLERREAWQYIGAKTPGGLTVDAEMSNAVDAYLRALRQLYPSIRIGGNAWIERRFHCPELHEYFYSTADFIFHFENKRILDVNDLKYGVGIAVNAEDNVQLLYYGAGALQTLGLWDEIDTLRLRIHQPRGFHPDGPVRAWEVPVSYVREWLHDVLLPGMDRAMASRETKSGQHCRFCPALTRACPQVVADMEEFEEMAKWLNNETAPALSPEQLSRFLELEELSRMAKKAAMRTALGRLNAGRKVPGRKLVQSSSDRQFKPGAEEAAKAVFGKNAFTEPTLKSPAQIDKLPGGTAFTAKWAFKPKGALTVARAEDVRKGVSADVKSGFTPVRKEKRNGAA